MTRRQMSAAIGVAIVGGVLQAVPPVHAQAPLAYVTVHNDIKVIDTSSRQVVRTITLPTLPKKIAVTPDGARAYVSDDLTVVLEVVDLATGATMAGVPIGTDVSEITVSPDGTSVYVLSQDTGSLSVVDTRTNKLTGQVSVGTERYAGRHGLAVNPGGSLIYTVRSIATSGTDGILSVVDAQTLQLMDVPLPIGNPLDVALSPDGMFAYVASAAGVVVVDTTTLEAVTTITLTPSGTPRFVRFAHNAPRAYVANSLLISVVDTDQKTEIGTITLSPLSNGLTVTPDDAFLYVPTSKPSSADPGLLVIDVATRTVVASLLKDTFYDSNDVAIAPPLPPAAATATPAPPTATRPPSPTRTSTRTRTPTPIGFVPPSPTVTPTPTASDTVTPLPTSTPTDTPTRTPRSTPAGPRTFAYVAVPESGAVAVVDIDTRAFVTTIPVGFGPRFIAARPDGSAVYVTDPSIVVMSVIDPSTNVIRASVPVGVEARRIAVARDGRRAYVMANGQGSVLAVDTASNTIVGSAFLGGALQLLQRSALAVSPDGKEVWAGNPDPNGGQTVVDVIDAASMHVLAAIPVPGGNTGSIAFSPNGSVAYVTLDEAVAVIDTTSRTVTDQITVSGGSPLDVAFAPNGNTAYVTNGAPLISVINTATRTEATTIELPNRAMGLAMSADGILVYAALAKESQGPALVVIDTSTNAVVDELLTQTDIFSGTDVALAVRLQGTPPPSPTPTVAVSICAQCTCTGDRDGNGGVTIDEIIAAVGYSLEGCPAAQ